MPQEQIGPLIKQISDRISATADASLKKHGLTFSQLRVLDFIHRRGGEVTQKEIEDFLGVAHPTVVGLVYRLEQKQFVKSSVDGADRRNKRVAVAGMWHTLRINVNQDRWEMEGRLQRGFSPEELEQLKGYLQRLYRNLE